MVSIMEKLLVIMTARLYPIFHINVSKRHLQIYESQTTTEISVEYKLRTTQTENDHVYFIVQFERQTMLQVSSYFCIRST